MNERDYEREYAKPSRSQHVCEHNGTGEYDCRVCGLYAGSTEYSFDQGGSKSSVPGKPRIDETSYAIKCVHCNLPTGIR
jgi:hypothetical protein